MTRRRAAWVAALVAVLLGATYLLTRRRGAAPPAVDLGAPEPAALATVVTSVSTPAAAEHEPLTTAEPLTAQPPEPRSWGATRAVPARTPPAAEAVAAVEPSSEVEEPLPTWVRVTIVVAALVAFFAVSLIATKQV